MHNNLHTHNYWTLLCCWISLKTSLTLSTSETEQFVSPSFLICRLKIDIYHEFYLLELLSQEFLAQRGAIRCGQWCLQTRGVCTPNRLTGLEPRSWATNVESSTHDWCDMTILFINNAGNHGIFTNIMCMWWRKSKISRWTGWLGYSHLLAIIGPLLIIGHFLPQGGRAIANILSLRLHRSFPSPPTISLQPWGNNGLDKFFCDIGIAFSVRKDTLVVDLQ